MSSLVDQSLKNLTAMQETQVWSLGQEVPLEKEMATDSSILAWNIPWTEEPGMLELCSQKESEKTERLNHSRRGHFMTNPAQQVTWEAEVRSK